MTKELLNNQNLGKPVIAALDAKSLFSSKTTYYDKWSIFRFFMTDPENAENINVELRKYRLKEDGSREYCDEIIGYNLSKKDPEVEKAINSLIYLSVQKGIELNHFRH